MVEVRLSELFKDLLVESLSDRKIFNSLLVSSISTDTRALKERDLFIAIPGESFDGHSFIADAVKKGALCIIYESSKSHLLKDIFGKGFPVLFAGVSDTRKAFGKMAENYLGMFKVRKVVVTGSVGKTTTKNLISSVLNQKFRVVTSPSSFNNDIGIPKTIFNVDNKTEVLVQELGTNHPGEIKYLSQIINQDHALITNVGPAHVGYFKSVENIAREKKDALKSLTPDGIAYINADDDFFYYLKKGLKVRVKSFGLNRGDLFPEEIKSIGVDRSEFVMRGENIVVKSPGVHGILNACASALIGLSFGLSMDEIKRGIEGYRGERGRGYIHQKDGVTIIDESYNANPLSVRASLAYLRTIPVSGRKIFLLGDMLELGEDSEHYHREIARDFINSGIDALYTYGQISGITGESCKVLGLNNVVHFSDVDDLLVHLKGDVRKGDFVLIKGSRGMKLERVVSGLINP